MKVKLLCSRVGITFEDHAGDVVDVPEDEGQALILNGSAVQVEPETMMAGPSEAMTKGKRGRRPRKV